MSVIVTGATVGTLATITATFRDAADALGDPGVVEFHVRAPDGTVATNAPTSHPSVGVFTRDVQITASGKWWARAIGTVSGPVTSGEVEIDVDPIHVA